MTTTPDNRPEPTPDAVPAPAADATPTEALVVHEQPPAAGSAPVDAVPAVASTKNGNQTRTILEIVGGVVALGAVAVAGVIGFVFGYAVRDHGHDRGDLSLSRAFGDDGPGRGGDRGAPGGPGNRDGQGQGQGQGPWHWQGQGARPGLPFGPDGQGPGMGQGWGFGGGQDGQGFGGPNRMPSPPDGTAPTAPDGSAPTAPGGGTTSSAPAPS